MYEKTIKYLEEKAHRNKKMHGSNKSHKDYAMGGRSVSSRNRSDYAKNYRRNSVNNSNNDYRRNDRRMRNQDYDDYDYEEEMMEDEAYYDYNDYAEEDMMKEYEEELKKWTKNLMKKDKFKLPKQEVLKKAEEMNIEFEDFSEEEFYAVYLMLVSDYPNIADNPHTYIVMAKQFLEDDDVNVEPSEKVCKYLYEIVLNEE